MIISHQWIKRTLLIKFLLHFKKKKILRCQLILILIHMIKKAFKFCNPLQKIKMKMALMFLIFKRYWPLQLMLKMRQKFNKSVIVILKKCVHSLINLLFLKIVFIAKWILDQKFKILFIFVNALRNIVLIKNATITSWLIHLKIFMKIIQIHKIINSKSVEKMVLISLIRRKW